MNTKSIVFYSTPHKGSRLANLSQATALLLWPSVEVQELREGKQLNTRITNLQFYAYIKYKAKDIEYNKYTNLGAQKSAIKLYAH